MDPPHKEYSVFNDDFSGQGSSSSAIAENPSFLPFSRLPTEIRLRVWTHCLPRNRLVSIRVSVPGVSYPPTSNLSGARTESGRYTTRNHLGHTVSGYPFRLHVPRYKQWSHVLLRVSHEAQQALLAFYRLSMPLQLGAAELLHLNPDTDILEVQREQLTPLDALAAFLHDAVAHDPCGVGIAHLAMGRNMNDVSGLATVDPSMLHPSAAQAITALLSTSVQTFYSCVSPGPEARNMLGVLSWPRGSIHHNRSVPVAAQGTKAQVVSIALLGRDPRPIETDLSHVAVGTDPRRNVFLWHRFLAKFGVQPRPPQMQIRYLLAIWPESWDATADSRTGFVEFLRAADARWAARMTEFKKPLWGARVSGEEHQRLERELRDVAGAWIFGADTFGEIPDSGEEEGGDGPRQWAPKMVADLTEFRPGLVVFQLSE